MNGAIPFFPVFASFVALALAPVALASGPQERVIQLRTSLPTQVSGGVDPATRTLLREPLTVDGALETAIRENRSLRATLRELGIFDGLHLQAGALPNPELEFDLRQPSEGADPLQAEVFIGFDLTHALLAGLRAEAVDRERDAARREAASALVALEYEVRSAYYAAQEADQAVTFGMRSLDAFAAARDAMRALAEAGNARAIDLALQEAAWEEARLSVSQLELARLEAFERLRRALGLHGDDARFTLPPLKTALPASPAVPADLEARAISSNLALAALDARAAAAAARTRLANAQGFLPDLSIDAHAEQDGARWEVGGGVSFKLPSFDTRRGDLLAAESAFDGLRERSEALATDVRSRAREARARLESAHARARHVHGVVLPARRKVAQETLRQYNAMQLGVFQLIAALRQELDAELVALGATRHYLTAEAALRALLDGQPVDAPTLAARSPSASPDAGGH